MSHSGKSWRIATPLDDDQMATMASLKIVLAVIMMMIFLSMIVYGSDRDFHLLEEVPCHMKPLECSDPRLKALFPC